MTEIFEIIKEIAFRIDNGIKNRDLGYSDNENPSGEKQLKLDIYSDHIIEDSFKNIDSIKGIISEEKDDILELSKDGKYIICYDPLDGSSLVDVNLSVGSIFGIYDNQPKGTNLLASAYIVYGPRIELVTVTREEKPKLYRAVGSKFKFIDNIKMDNKGKINASGGTQKNWKKHHKKFIESLFSLGYRLRYSGGMVPDLHQVLLKRGGIFSYPDMTDKPKGKLRQLFEVIPFALVYENAGGEAIDNRGMRLLELTPNHIHDTSPCFFGSKDEIALMKKSYGIKN